MPNSTSYNISFTLICGCCGCDSCGCWLIFFCGFRFDCHQKPMIHTHAYGIAKENFNWIKVNTKQAFRQRFFLRRSFSLLGEEGLEPSRPCGHSALNAACLPISPLAHFEIQCARMGSNHRPLSYQDSVLPLNYTREKGTIAKKHGGIKQKTLVRNGRKQKGTGGTNQPVPAIFSPPPYFLREKTFRSSPTETIVGVGTVLPMCSSSGIGRERPMGTENLTARVNTSGTILPILSSAGGAKWVFIFLLLKRIFITTSDLSATRDLSLCDRFILKEE